MKKKNLIFWKEGRVGRCYFDLCSLFYKKKRWLCFCSRVFAIFSLFIFLCSHTFLVSSLQILHFFLSRLLGFCLSLSFLDIQRRPVIFHVPPFIVYVTLVSRLSTCYWRPGDAERASWVSEAVYRSTQPDASFTWPDLVHDFKCNRNIKKNQKSCFAPSLYTLVLEGGAALTVACRISIWLICLVIYFCCVVLFVFSVSVFTQPQGMALILFIFYF